MSSKRKEYHAQFDSQRGHPFALRNVHLFTSMSEMENVIGGLHIGVPLCSDQSHPIGDFHRCDLGEFAGHKEAGRFLLTTIN